MFAPSRSLLCAASFLYGAFAGDARAGEAPIDIAPVIELPDLSRSTFILGSLSATDLKQRIAKLIQCSWSKEDYFPTSCSSYLVELSVDKDNTPLLRMTYENPPSNGSLEAKHKIDRAQVIAVATLLGQDSSRISAWLTTALDESERGTPQSSAGILDGTNPVFALVCNYHPLGENVPENGYTDVFFTGNPKYILGGCGQ